MNNNKERSNGMRLPGEGDRSTEFKTSRDKIVGEVNSFLDTLRGIQTEGGSTKVGILATVPRMKQTSLGPSGPNIHLLATEYAPGAALYQQHPDKGGAYVLESVSVRGNNTETVHITGTAEVSRSLHEITGPISEHAHGEIIASFGVENISETEEGSYYRYDFDGGGGVRKHFIDLLGGQGVNKGIPVSTIEGLEMAQLALDNIRKNILT